jgi:hypothetical protein
VGVDGVARRHGAEPGEQLSCCLDIVTRYLDMHTTGQGVELGQHTTAVVGDHARSDPGILQHGRDEPGDRPGWHAGDVGPPPVDAADVIRTVVYVVVVCRVDGEAPGRLVRRERYPYPADMESTPPTCDRHPDVETRLRCSACDSPICFECAQSAAVGFKCPDCAAQLEGTTATRASEGGALARLGASFGGSRSSSSGGASGASGEPLPIAIGVRATVVGLAAAFLGGAILGPVLQGGAFFLLSSGIIGWAVARAVYWATDERNSPYVRAIAMTLSGFAVAVGLGVASVWVGGRGSEIVFLAYPAALYGGWIVVRQR